MNYENQEFYETACLCACSIAVGRVCNQRIEYRKTADAEESGQSGQPAPIRQYRLDG